MSRANAYGATDGSALRPFQIERREPGPRDVQIDVLFCGVCHSDVHTARGEWPGTVYPCVPGHEIVGKVTHVGAGVTRFAVGDVAAVGCLVDSCGSCASCLAGQESYCPRVTWTYNSRDKRGPGPVTYGGYSSHIVVDEAFCLRVPPGLDLAAAAPLLCAGITTYSPLKRWRAAGGTRVGVVGLGGLGHMAVKLAHALGAETVLFTSSETKLKDARWLGADEALLSTDLDAMKAQAGRFDLILDTVAAPHDLDAYTSLLALDGTLVLLGVPKDHHPAPSIGKLVARRRSLAGSLVGGLRETQELLDFCAARGIGADVEVIAPAQLEVAYARMIAGDVRYRFVLDLASLKGTPCE